MSKLVSGSILLGFGTLSSIAYRWVDIQAYSVPLWQKILVFALIAGGLALIVKSLMEDYGE